MNQQEKTQKRKAGPKVGNLSSQSPILPNSKSDKNKGRANWTESDKAIFWKSIGEFGRNVSKI
jgi:hypothetical protein